MLYIISALVARIGLKFRKVQLRITKKMNYMLSFLSIVSVTIYNIKSLT